ncbi:glycosyltransferase family 2 protein [Maritimibacter sp. DP1N21-5]|uniref:glycosyltransferase family 2 protein n=1 Tax=Maritimibacter sp. DP1N21-5 TaxID=2836867 RepID=UPI001C480FC7|nr:glycosyltransferase family 2 protein [Maritimibacter sp. DP1N21-5]MBV7410687.1 glycosyltransferase family 2 protein [Maritimibacter sp. DP1N21-5]
MILTAAIFWVAVALIAYAIVGYPLALLALWKLRGRRRLAQTVQPRNVDFLIPAHNEADHIEAKIANTLAQSNPHGHAVRVIVVSDGSTDDTLAIARGIEDPRVEVIETPGRAGKLGALNQGLAACAGDVIIFSDANGLLDDGAMAAIMRHFEDPEVGGVCGKITVARTGDIAKADGFFWRYDQAMKQAESDLGGVVSAQGSLYAIRRTLTAPLPQGVADDFLMSTRVVDQGFRLAFEPRAQAREHVTERAGDEMARRVRSTVMGWAALMQMRHLMNPARTGLYGWQLFSHKFLRRLVPVFLIAAFVTNLLLIGTTPFWSWLGSLQTAAYALVLAAWVRPELRRLPLVGPLMFFVISNLAMLIGLWRYYRGERVSVWTPVRDMGAATDEAER